MSNVDKYMPLKEGEEVICELKGNAYTMSSNILGKILGLIARILAAITGSLRSIEINVTHHRVLVFERQKMFWFFDKSISVRSYSPRTISLVGYTMQKNLFIFRNHYLEFIASSTSMLIKARGGKDKVLTTIGAITDMVGRQNK